MAQVWSRAAVKESNHVLLFVALALPLTPPTPQEGEEEAAKRSNHLQRKLDERKLTAKVDPHVEDQFTTGRLYGVCGTVCIFLFLACVFSACYE